MSEITAQTAIRRPSPPPQVAPLPGAKPSGPAAHPQADDPIRRAAETFEAAFLAEMLRHSGLGRMPATFNGGAGEAAFSGTLIEAYAKQIAASSRLGLAEQIYRALLARGGG
jgi:Rod binding domain-containing protein